MTARIKIPQQLGWFSWAARLILGGRLKTGIPYCRQSVGLVVIPLDHLTGRANQCRHVEDGVLRHIQPLLKPVTVGAVGLVAVGIAISQDQGIHIDATPDLLGLNRAALTHFKHLPVGGIIQHSLRRCSDLLSDPPLQRIGCCGQDGR